MFNEKILYTFIGNNLWYYSVYGAGGCENS